jgi:hypothetical protein
MPQNPKLAPAPARLWTAAAAGLPCAALMLALAAGRASAQLPNPSAAATGMGENFTAVARGYAAPAWNPAGLGLGRPGAASLTLLAGRAGHGLGPVGVPDMIRWTGDGRPDDVREDWLARIRTEGGQRGTGEVEGTWVAFHAGRYAVHAATTVRAISDLTPELAEMVMYGSAIDRTARDADLSGSEVALQAWSTVGVAVALPYDTEAGRAAIGIGAHYSVGHAMAFTERSRGAAVSDPPAARLDMPMVQTPFDADGLRLDNGRGFGLDLAAALASNGWTFAVNARNVVSRFRWHEERLQYRPLALHFDEGAAVTDVEARPLAEAPASLRARAAALRFAPAWSIGVAWSRHPALVVAGDVRWREADGMLTGPARHAGAGIELRPLRWMPLHAGGAHISMGDDDAGWQAATGLGVEIAGIAIGASAMRRETRRLGGTWLLTATVFSTGRP